MLALLGSTFVLFVLHDMEVELFTTMVTGVTIALCGAGRYYLAWWDTDRLYSDWRHYLAWRNIGLSFWCVQLLVAFSDSQRHAIVVHARLSTLSEGTVVMYTFLIAGFLAGVEPGDMRTKLATAFAIVAVIAMRLFVLAHALQPLEDGAARASQLMLKGSTNLIVSPVIGSIIGLITRTRLDAQSARMEEMAAALAEKTYNDEEIRWLREHAFELESARKEALVRSRPIGSGHHSSSSSDGSSGARRRAGRGEFESSSLDGIREH